MSASHVLALLPAFNPQPHQLKRSLNSLLTQTVPIDICVIDDGSAQPVSRLVEHCQNLLHIRLERNCGITQALDIGMRHGLERGYDYVCRLDVGDIAYSHRVEAQLSYMEAHKDIDLLGAFADVSSVTGQEIGRHGTAGGPASVKRYLRHNAAFKHSTFFLRASSIRRFGGYDLSFDMAQDYELALRLAQIGKVDCLEDALIDYVDDPAGLSTRRRKRQLHMRLKAQWRHANAADIESYLGIARTLALIAAPSTLAKKLSIMRWRAAVADGQG